MRWGGFQTRPYVNPDVVGLLRFLTRRVAAGVKRTGKTSGKAANPRRRKAASRKRAVVAKHRAGGDRAGDLGLAALQAQLEQKTRELDEALAQQAATAHVLRVISSSPGELEPVFQAMLENAVRICEAKFGVLNLHEDGMLRMGAVHNVPPAFAEFLRGQGGAYRPTPGSLLDRVMRTKQVGHTAGDGAEPVAGRATTLGGARSTVCVPMLKDDVLIGAITIYRQEVRPFTEKQIALLQNFAAQAVIAIENTRLLSELRESLDRQTATADVLRVISSSPGQLEPVFQSMLENAVRICGAQFGNFLLFDGKDMRLAARINAPPALIEEQRTNPVINLKTSIAGLLT